MKEFYILQRDLYEEFICLGKTLGFNHPKSQFLFDFMILIPSHLITKFNSNHDLKFCLKRAHLYSLAIP